MSRSGTAVTPKAHIPQGFMEMPGFPGVFAGVREDVLGMLYSD
jgi:hypothetical protein